MRLRLKETNALARRAREARKQHEREKKDPRKVLFRPRVLLSCPLPPTARRNLV